MQVISPAFWFHTIASWQEIIFHTSSIVTWHGDLEGYCKFEQYWGEGAFLPKSLSEQSLNLMDSKMKQRESE